MKKHNSKKRKLYMIILGVLISIFCIILLGFFIAQKKKHGELQGSHIINFARADYEKCFFRDSLLGDVPLHEYIHLSINGEQLHGEKKMSGPDHDRTGTIESTAFENNIHSVQYLYHMNDVPKIEEERYSINEDGNLVKHEYLLLEDPQTDIIKMDISAPIGRTVYYATECKE